MKNTRKIKNNRKMENVELLKVSKEWFRSLSYNEQKSYCQKYLKTFEKDYLIGNLYVSLKRWNELHIKLYELFHQDTNIKFI